ncbi:MAG TPA: hypothetical protein VFA29_08360, partial [Candidatus Baltobacteraceae bacterium]|nr:hypothetical protein [Candidatus Baltobacteraceae bacterium]
MSGLLLVSSLLFAGARAFGAQAADSLAMKALSICASGEERDFELFFREHLDTEAIKAAPPGMRAFNLTRLCRATGGFKISARSAEASYQASLDANELPGFHANLTLEMDADGKIARFSLRPIPGYNGVVMSPNDAVKALNRLFGDAAAR